MTGGGEKMRLLLAEDERALSNVLVTILKHNNYTVDAVYNGADALDYLACATYDGVILDIMMPKVDGIEVLKRIRAAGNKVPVLLLTNSDFLLLAFCLAAGAFDRMPISAHQDDALCKEHFFRCMTFPTVEQAVFAVIIPVRFGNRGNDLF